MVTASLQQQNWSGNGVGAAAVAPPEHLLVHPSVHTLLHFRAGIRRKEGLLIAQFSDFLPENYSVLWGIAWLGVRPAERLRPAGFARLEDFAQLDLPSWKVSPGWSCPVGGFHPAEGLFFQGTRGPWASNATFVQAAGKHLVRTSQDPRHAGGSCFMV